LLPLRPGVKTKVLGEMVTPGGGVPMAMLIG